MGILLVVVVVIGAAVVEVEVEVVEGVVGLLCDKKGGRLGFNKV